MKMEEKSLEVTSDEGNGFIKLERRREPTRKTAEEETMISDLIEEPERGKAQTKDKNKITDCLALPVKQMMKSIVYTTVQKPTQLIELHRIVNKHL